MKKIFTFLFLGLFAVSAWAQGQSVSDQLKADPRKAYGNDYPYQPFKGRLTKAPSGYKPFYISHYSRHGSRYYWTGQLYTDLDKQLAAGHEKHVLTPRGEKLYKDFMAVKDELNAGVGELTQLGWDQHQGIARTMYGNFPEVFKKGGNVMAISSLNVRCVLSMSAFCQELVQCNPKLEIREESARHTLDGVVPTDRQNPVKHKVPRPKPRYEANRERFFSFNTLPTDVARRIFSSTEDIPGEERRIGENIINLYKSLPNIGKEGMMDGIVTDEELARIWEADNLGSYSWVFGPQYETVPVLEDILKKAEAVVSGKSDRVADLRFGHDTILGPLTVLMGINGADRDPEDPSEVKNIYQNWETCKASNIQLVFYKSKKSPGDVLLKCLLNGQEASLPVPTTMFPYYKWSDFRDFYTNRCNTIKKLPVE